MAKENLTIKAFKNKIFAKLGDEFVRTVPMEGSDAPYIGYIKTTIGEAKVPFDNKLLHDTMSGGEEITQKEYEEGVLTAVNKL